MPQWRLQHGEHYLLTGEPVIVAELTSSITRSIELLLVAVLLAMAAALSLVFRGRPRLLPLGIAALAAALTFGALAAVGASLTVAQVAVLPVLVGLAVDYAIQFQSRVQEARAAQGARRPAAIRHAAATGGPTIARRRRRRRRRAARDDALARAHRAGLRAAAGRRHRDRPALRTHRRLGRARADGGRSGGHREAQAPGVGEGRLAAGRQRAIEDRSARDSPSVEPSARLCARRARVLLARRAGVAARQPAHPPASPGSRSCTRCATPAA